MGRELLQRHSEDVMDALHVVFCVAVIIVDTVLLLLDVCELCVAESPDKIAHLYKYAYLSLKALVEILLGNSRVAISP